MNHDSRKFNRRSIRLKNHDYSSPGGYFVTICTNRRIHLFGSVRNGCMELNEAGRMVAKWIAQTPVKFPGCIVDSQVIMPNHIHLVWILTRREMLESDPGRAENPDPGRVKCVSLGTIIQWFKTMTTNEYIRHVKKDGWQPFPGRLWQRNYYERIIRNENALERIRAYIAHNPTHWPP